MVDKSRVPDSKLPGVVGKSLTYMGIICLHLRQRGARVTAIWRYSWRYTRATCVEACLIPAAALTVFVTVSVSGGIDAGCRVRETAEELNCRGARSPGWMSTGGRSGLLCNGDFSRAPRVNGVWAQAETGQERSSEIAQGTTACSQAAVELW